MFIHRPISYTDEWNRMQLPNFCVRDELQKMCLDLTGQNFIMPNAVMIHIAFYFYIYNRT